MRRLVLAGLGTVSSLVLVLAYPTSQGTALSSTSSAATTGTTGTTATTGTTGESTTAAGSTDTSSRTSSYTGDVVDTRFGPVQVQISVANGKITAVDAVQYPDGDGHSQRINSYAVPTLNSEALAAQSAQIDSVSGATYTSDAYVQSLQSALDAAHL
jgi:uncharacterized protein with FMN-binding domain